jgi:hypothetical protein
MIMKSRLKKKTENEKEDTRDSIPFLLVGAKENKKQKTDSFSSRGRSSIVQQNANLLSLVCLDHCATRPGDTVQNDSCIQCIQWLLGY